MSYAEGGEGSGDFGSCKITLVSFQLTGGVAVEAAWNQPVFKSCTY